MSMTESEALEKHKEDCRRCKDKACERNIQCLQKKDIEVYEEIQQYRAIGTVSEFRELKEKATPKKPIDVRYFGEAGYYIGLCPTCKSGNNSEYEYCGDCGQKLQWFERSEGKE